MLLKKILKNRIEERNHFWILWFLLGFEVGCNHWQHKVVWDAGIENIVLLELTLFFIGETFIELCVNVFKKDQWLIYVFVIVLTIVVSILYKTNLIDRFVIVKKIYNLCRKGLDLSFQLIDEFLRFSDVSNRLCVLLIHWYLKWLNRNRIIMKNIEISQNSWRIIKIKRICCCLSSLILLFRSDCINEQILVLDISDRNFLLGYLKFLFFIPISSFFTGNPICWRNQPHSWCQLLLCNAKWRIL